MSSLVYHFLSRYMWWIPPSTASYSSFKTFDNDQNFKPIIKQNSHLENLTLHLPIINHCSYWPMPSILISLDKTKWNNWKLKTSSWKLRKCLKQVFSKATNCPHLLNTNLISVSIFHLKCVVIDVVWAWAWGLMKSNTTCSNKKKINLWVHFS